MSSDTNDETGDIEITAPIQTVPLVLNVGYKVHLATFIGKSMKIFIRAMLKFMCLARYVVSFLLSEYTKDVFWTGLQIFFALMVLATLSLATIFITIVENVKQAFKSTPTEITGNKIEELQDEMDDTLQNDEDTIVGDCKDVDRNLSLKRPGSQVGNMAVPIAI